MICTQSFFDGISFFSLRSLYAIRTILRQEGSRAAVEAVGSVFDEMYQERLSALRSMPYKDYLDTPEWKDTRKRILARARYKCQLCSSKDSLHIHHNSYDNLGQEQWSDLIVLCENCHAKHHDKVIKTK